MTLVAADAYLILGDSLAALRMTRRMLDTLVALTPVATLAAGNNLGEILVWDLPEKPEKLPEKPEKSAGKKDPADRPGAAVPPARRLDGHTNVISKLLATSDGRWLISASYDHTIRYWDLQASAERQPPDKTGDQRQTTVVPDRLGRQSSAAKAASPQRPARPSATVPSTRRAVTAPCGMGIVTI